jgi:TetR/AcrR family transcriptional regulator, cholesterol catabolism regulator
MAPGKRAPSDEGHAPSGERLPAQQPGSATFERLLATAAVLFRKKGYAETSTRELSTMLGIQRSSLYHHIAGKQDLLYLISLAALRRLRTRVEEAVEKVDGPREKIAALIAAHMTTILENRNQHAAGLLELRALTGPRRKEIVGLRDAYEELVRSLIEEGQRAGAVRDDVPARNLTLMLLNMMNWSVIWYSPGCGVTPADLARDMVAVFVQGCLPAADIADTT